MFGNPLKESGGEGLRYFNTVRFALQDKKQIIEPRKNNEVVGNWIGVEVLKTRLGPCYRKCFVPHYYETGINYYGGYARVLMNRGYLRPKNKEEFNKFRQTTLVYEQDEEKKNEVDEFKIASFLEKHPELLFDKFPPFCGFDDSTSKDGYEKEDEFFEIEDGE